MNLRNLWHIQFTSSRIRMFRILSSFMAILIVLILMYVYVWRALYEDFILPPGISAEDPAVNMTLLQQLNQERLQRVRTVPPSFEKAGLLFPN